MGRRDEDEGVSPRARARLTGRPGRVADAAAPERSGRVEYVARPEDLVADVRRLAGRGGGAGGAAAAEATGGDGATGGATGRHRRARPPQRRWVRLPASFVGARWQPGRSAVLGVLAVALLAVLVVGARVAWARSGAEPVVVAPGGGARAGPTGVSVGAAPVGLSGVPTPSGSPAASASGTTPAEVVVHVVGEVREPGVQRLPAGSRVADAVAAAGGTTRRADVGAVNLARQLVDGEQVRVPAPGEAPPASGVPAAGAAAGAAGTPGPAPVSLNTGDLAALDTLPGVGPVLAQRIVDWRTTHGRFTSVDELTEVSGIGETMLARLRPLVTT